MTEAVTPPNPADGGSRSEPDPSLLTIDALRREIAMQMTAMETGLESAEKLTIERFRRIDALMERSEEQRREQKADTAAAVTAALDSQKEATAKMERSISDQIASLRANFETEVRSLRSSLGDLKDGMTRLDSIKQGASEQKFESRQSMAGVYAAIGAATALIVTVLAVIGFVIA